MLKKLRSFARRPLARVVIVLIMVGLLQLGYIGYAVAATPSNIRKPEFEHYHFRMQIIADGMRQVFSQEKYQVQYAKDQCTIGLAEEPIHFHDQKDQITHIHWKGITGGMVLKYYGWNLIGGSPASLGYRLDKGLPPKQAKIHGKVLQPVPSTTKYFVYIGDEKGYTEKSFEDWLSQDIESFFGVKSNLPETPPVSLYDRLIRKFSATAHADTATMHGGQHSESHEQKLTRVNNLLGNVVIFAQKDAPTSEQITARFNDLEPLSESTCGG